MTAGEICARLRAMAREELGADVFCPREPCALFVCRQRPAREGACFTVPDPDGSRRVYLTAAGLAYLYSLFPRELEPEEPAGKNAALLTRAARCLKEERSDNMGEDAVFTLHCLSLNRQELLRQKLPGLLAQKLRRHERPDRLTGLLILNEFARSTDRV